MSHRKPSTESGAAARDRGGARLRAVTISATAASLIAAGGLAFILPGAATASTAGTSSGSAAGTHHAASGSGTSPGSGTTSGSGTSKGSSSSGLSSPSSTPSSSSGSPQVTSGGS
jgi:hypothetical protein